MQKLLIALLLFLGFGCQAQKGDKDKLPGKWIQLFNGKDLKDWDIKIRGHDLNDNFANTFRVEDGLLKVRYDGYDKFDERFGHIFYKKKFSAYLLVVECRFVGKQCNGGPAWAIRNNGAMIHSQSAASMGKDQDFPISLEVQLLGGNGTDPRSTGNLCTPGTNVVMDGKLITEHCISSTSKTYAGEQWVTVSALVLRDSIIRHIVEGDTVITYTKPQIGGGSVTDYDPAVKKDGQPLTAGYIALQGESAPTDFRKIAVFDLEPYMNDPKKLNEVIHQLQESTKPTSKQQE